MKKKLTLMLCFALALTFMICGVQLAEAAEVRGVVEPDMVEVQSISIDWEERHATFQGDYFYVQKAVGGSLYRGYLVFSHQAGDHIYRGRLYLHPHPYPTPYFAPVEIN